MKRTLLLWLVAAASAEFVHGPGGSGNVQFRSQGPEGYNFGYRHSHGAGGGASWQKETADSSGNVVGSYGLRNVDGRFRVVNYVAGDAGFRADVLSNEPGLQGPVSVPPQWTPPQPAGVGQGVPGVGPWVSPQPAFGPQTTGGNPYSFSYDGTITGGSFHSETGDASGVKRGSYGLPGRTVNYVADAGGFRATVTSNEAGVDTAQSPADVTVSSGSGAPGPPPGDTPPIYPGRYLGEAADSRGAGGLPVGRGATGHGSQDAWKPYEFAYGESLGPFQRESGDAAGNKKGVYGLKDPDGRFRTVNYVADAGGFRASVQTNEPGVDDAQSPADVAVNKQSPPAGGVAQYPSSGAVHAGFPGSAAVIVPANPASNFPGGAALVPLGSPQAGFPGGVPLVPSGSPHAGIPGVSSVPWSGAGGAAVPGGPAGTGFGTQDATGAYNFAYGDDQGIGPWQKESGDASGNKAGTYGLKDSDGRFRTVNYAAGPGGFTAGVHTNEPGVDGAQSPADVSVSKSPEPAGLAQGVLPGQPGLLGAPVLVPTSPEYPGAGVPVSTGYGTFDAPSGSYNFGYAGTAGGGFHTESGDSNGFKKGTYGLNGPDGQIRTVHYVADAGGFRANVQSNEPGVDSSKNPADVNFGHPGGAISGVSLGPPSTGPALAPWAPAQSGPWNQVPNSVLGSPAVPAVAPPQGPWTAHSSGPWSPPSNPRPGSFFYKTQVLGPQQSFVKVHQY
ncbi:collagen alpha-2(I) chain [Ixodes scapularis]